MWNSKQQDDFKDLKSVEFFSISANSIIQASGNVSYYLEYSIPKSKSIVSNTTFGKMQAFNSKANASHTSTFWN